MANHRIRWAVFVAALGVSTAALPAVARADDNTQQFASPSGNIHCLIDMVPSAQGPAAFCQIKDYSYSVPEGVARDERTGEPCPSHEYGSDFGLYGGQPGMLRCSYSALASGVGPWPTLDYGQTRTLGSITCDSESDGVTCTDAGSGHFFRVSAESYQLG